jgi:lipoprotein-anchoring transpeptidase ErfK/SrfK
MLSVSRSASVVRCGRPVVIVSLLVLGVAAKSAQAGDPESTLRTNLAWQIALESVGISPGLIDGKIGPKTQLATREFQRVRGLPMTGELDDRTANALNLRPDEVIGRYTIQAEDLEEVGPLPRSWRERARLKRLGHESLETVVAERFHCHRELLRTLNPGRDIARLKAGDRVVVPIVAEPPPITRAALVEVNLAEKVIRVMDDQKRLVALFHCSVAASKTKLPRGKAEVSKVAENPTYTFNPRMWPEVKEPISEPITIPPGPRNPVGRCWIGLSLPGYGIHGTPVPELIGKTGSHGCIRLANWDALRLARMVSVGTAVRFENESDTQIVRRD